MMNLDPKKFSTVEQPAKEMPDMKDVRLKLTQLRLHASGVFSNVYRGTLELPNGKKEIAIKKTWPENRERNFETMFLAGVGRERHKNIVQMLYAFTNKAKDDRMCESYVFDFMPDTLASLVKEQPLDTTDLKLYTWQMLNGLKYLASECIVHRDIKPINILVDHPHGHLKIGDFGSAKIIQPGMHSTAYQVTRFYRPPELLLNSADYTSAVDVWSAGCVFGEILRGSVLFPGRDTKHQLRLVVACLGSPTEEDLIAMKCPSRCDERRPPAGFGSLISGASEESMQFLEKMLVYKPQDRLGGKEALRHTFFDSIFAKGVQRWNGQLISHIITAQDVKDAMSNDRGRGRRLTALMNKKIDMQFSSEGMAPGEIDSREAKKNRMGRLNSNSDSEDVHPIQPTVRRNRTTERTRKNGRTALSSTTQSMEKICSKERVISTRGGPNQTSKSIVLPTAGPRSHVMPPGRKG